MFVSPQAVHAFWGEFSRLNVQPGQDHVGFVAAYFQALGGAAPRCWAPGPGTARALKDVGVPICHTDQPSVDSAQYDSESLWAVAGPSVQPGDMVLLVRGHTPDSEGSSGRGRDWLAAQCERKGAHVAYCVAYSRVAPDWTTEQQSQALTARGPAYVWLLTSSESVGHLQRLLPGQSWSDTLALVTHPRIASAAARLGFVNVLSSRPALADVLEALAKLSAPKMPRTP